ncbi:hypothetical protein [Halospina sp. K52047b]|uniref:hypothetical protein n=1 Tax=Halospina sp. K52047b TaxID=2614160 RepID=UPI00124AAC41|nr:hypothetical protein [Halospina sp. K52047b]KAA8980826.1 hypothetical protein F3089_11510 [Halospina sp. K52047b]
MQHEQMDSRRALKGRMMNSIAPKDIGEGFLLRLAERVEAQSSLYVSLTGSVALRFPSPSLQVQGYDWNEQLASDQSFDFIVLDLPLGLKAGRVNIGGAVLSARRGWVDLYHGLNRLNTQGICCALLEPGGFGVRGGAEYLEILKQNGFYLQGIFDLPEGVIDTSRIKPIVAVFGHHSEGMTYPGFLMSARKRVYWQRSQRQDDPQQLSLVRF